MQNYCKPLFLMLLAFSGLCIAAPGAGTPGQAAQATEATEPAGAPPLPAFQLLGREVPAGNIRQLRWSASQNFAGMNLNTPVLVAHGTKPGKVLCLTAAVHGDELNGIEIVRRLIYSQDPKNLSGTIVGVPIVNLHGFQRSSRYLADRRDLNRHFPGSPRGSSASRIAASFFKQVLAPCEALVDIHTGSFHRTNITQARADLSHTEVLALSQGMGGTPVLNSVGAEGTLRRAATQAGIPAITLEVGEPHRLQPELVAQGVKAIQSLMYELGMREKRLTWSDPQPVFYESQWVRVSRGGILLSTVKLGAKVNRGQLLGTVTDPITNAYNEIHSPFSGRVLGMALNQVVMPGYAAYHIGIERSEEELVNEAESEPSSPAPETSGTESHDADAIPAEEEDHPK
ncbi:MAG: succinylglutamate desuccinylase/aspartoacylase family protein [Salinisphaeraceae bacterium]|nr:succinylglutamate desuccinylase/aspartoacylase family protein [Salinisphaeraceae bacterium]